MREPDAAADGPTSRHRQLGWEGFHNARDLGGLPTLDGGTTRFGAYVRSAEPTLVTTAGWRAALDAGVRTIVDLRNDDEVRPVTGEGPTRLAGTALFSRTTDTGVAPAGCDRWEVPLEGIDDLGFWREINGNGVNGTPLYYRPFLARKAQRCAAVVTALARCRPGTVVYHCSAGRDRAGLVTLLLLEIAGVDREAIVTDYELSYGATAELYAAMGRQDDDARIREVLAARETTAREAVVDALAGFDVVDYLLTAGVGEAEIAEIHRRLRG